MSMRETAIFKKTVNVFNCFILLNGKKSICLCISVFKQYVVIKDMTSEII